MTYFQVSDTTQEAEIGLNVGAAKNLFSPVPCVETKISAYLVSIACY